MADTRRHYLDLIRQDGVHLTPELAAAFATVPRELFVPTGFRRRDGGWVAPADPDFLATVYRNDVLVTKLNGDVPISSSSQPSLMAIMLRALDVRPGMRVLEIGAGTGYNAALLATLGAEVTSVDVQEDVAVRARAALDRAGITGVRVTAGDGYLGDPDARYDRIIVTVGVAGLSPHWFAQLAPDGLVIAPVEHAGHHPVLSVRPGDPATAAVVCSSGFMAAAGPLGARHAGSHPSSAGALPELAETAPARWSPPLTTVAYRDLWYAVGAWHRRATLATPADWDRTRLVLLDEAGSGGAAIQPDGSVHAGGPEAARCTAVATTLIDRWLELGRPEMRGWQVGLALDGDPAAPIWVPHTWQIVQGRAPR
ncbi:protein-L-isoaspartate O-methyltransferase [Actinoplanes sp. L3-i22]|uniref:protein-L-isoaspartate O-methyltransferase family protein n=1 Tax=Actinoplanes sp. L3-i22 TaxID=2836373 RepID=UPI001C78AFC6|nr:methyltransferase domain-containing protein [Actinoplanes sp. L3-i22]BCY13795.1 protein-L-isoaspartate O-methyltransferase [Actinoplanes sp. L3-i22]